MSFKASDLRCPFYGIRKNNSKLIPEKYQMIVLCGPLPFCMGIKTNANEFGSLLHLRLPLRFRGNLQAPAQYPITFA